MIQQKQAVLLLAVTDVSVDGHECCFAVVLMMDYSSIVEFMEIIFNFISL
jgi:hypothetical protein